MSIQENQDYSDYRQIVEVYESQIEKLQEENLLMKNSLKNQLQIKAENLDLLMEKVEDIQDPHAIVIINNLLYLIKQYEKENVGQNQNLVREKSKGKIITKSINEFDKIISKSKLEKQKLLIRIKDLEEQNDFLNNQLNYCQRKLNVTGEEQQNIPEQKLILVQKLLGVKDDYYFEQNLAKIKHIVQILPTLQHSLEQIYDIVVTESIIPIECNNYQQLLETIQSWAQNLRDYQNLVSELFQMFSIKESSQKNKGFLMNKIKSLLNTDHQRQLEQYSLENQKLVIENKTFAFFCQQVKSILGLESYSNEGALEKVLQLIANKNKQQISLKQKK